MYTQQVLVVFAAFLVIRSLCVQTPDSIPEYANLYSNKNALEQAMHYLLNVSPLAKIAPVDYAAYLQLTTGCMESIELKNPNQQKCMNAIMNDAHKKRENATFRFWHLMRRNEHLHARLHCSYAWRFIKGATPRQLQIHQHNCTSANYTQGGAGFEVLAVSLNAAKQWPALQMQDGARLEPRVPSAQCEVQDYYNGSYAIRCPVIGTGTGAGAGCTAYVPVFDYEGYSQYNELFAVKSLRSVGGVGATANASATASTSTSGETNPYMDILVACESTAGGGDEYSLERAPKGLKSYNDLIQYIEPQPEAPAKGGTWDSKKIQACLLAPQRPILMYGDSHLRYIFDWLATQYMPTQKAEETLMKLPHHHGYLKFPPHGSEKTGYVSYYPIKYLHHTAQKIDNACYESEVSNAAEGITLVLGGTGTWDLDTLPLRNVIEEGVSKQIFDKLRTLVFECKYIVRVIWITAPPIPAITTPHYRNNYNLAALNAFFVKGISKIQRELIDAKEKARNAGSRTASQNVDVSQEPIWLNTIEIVDVFSIIFPHIHTSDVKKCQNHYLCRENYQQVKSASRTKGIGGHVDVDVWSTTAAGLQVVHRLTSVMCDVGNGSGEGTVPF